MIPVCNGLLQQGIIEILKDMWQTLLAQVIEFYVYILIAIGLVVLYFVVTKVILRAKVYKTAQKEPACVLSMSGRERSLEYLEKFGSITGLEAQVIRYLRKRKLNSLRGWLQEIDEDSSFIHPHSLLLTPHSSLDKRFLVMHTSSFVINWGSSGQIYG